MLLISRLRAQLSAASYSRCCTLYWFPPVRISATRAAGGLRQGASTVAAVHGRLVSSGSPGVPPGVAPTGSTR